MPLSKGEISDALDAADGEAKACEKNGGPILAKMSTLNVARDLDQMRQAVGDERLQYAGYSYGTTLGAVYANVFPDRVGRMILEGPVDPAARANHRVDNKRGGFEKARRGFLGECAVAGEKKCALAAGDGTPAQKFARIRTKLRKRQVQVSQSETVTLSTVTDSVSGALYQRATLVELATGLHELYEALFTTESQTKSERSLRLLAGPWPDSRLDEVPGVTSKTSGDAYDYNGDDSFFGVNCADSRLPRSRAEYSRIATSYERPAPTFGRSEAFSEAACAFWPEVPDRYTGPRNSKTANPVLVAGQTHDPATPYSTAKRMAAELGNARLLSIDGFGHCSQDSVCSQRAEARYVLTGQLPKPGERCSQDPGPFDEA